MLYYEFISKKNVSLLSRKTADQGFTLLEMIISVGIFSVVVVASIGITIIISNAQVKTSNIQAIQDNVRFSLELITKEMRTGINYTPTTYGNLCGGGASPSSPTEISFINSANTEITYYLDSDTDTLMKISDGSKDCNNAVAFTSEEVKLSRILFLLKGNNSGPEDGQPIVTISLSAKSKGEKPQLESSMNLQTTVTQRLRDL